MNVVCVKVANLRKLGYSSLLEWNEDPSNLYVGRRCGYVKGADKSKWHNPYTVKKYGIEECLRLYEEHIRSSLWDDLSELDDILNLGCWCVEEDLCHAGVLRRLYDEYVRGE